MKFYLLLISIFVGLSLQASPPPRDVYTTISDGIWSNALTWDLGVPSNNQTNSSDDIIITHNVTLNGDLDVKTGTNITITGCDTLHVTGNVTFNNGSSITVDSCAVLMVDGSVTNNNNSTNVVINGTIIIAGDYDGGNGSELGGLGSMDVSGSVTTDGDGTVFNSPADCVSDCDNSNDMPLSNPLPIELIWFVGNVIGDDIELIWLVASELNNDYYLIYEMFPDGDSFVIDTVDGVGTTTNFQQYSYTIKNPIGGVHYYYLKQVDFDGRFEVFNTISVYKKITNDKRSIVVWPNPSFEGEDINISIKGFKGKEVLLVLLDVHGKIHYEKVILSLLENTIIVIESNLAPGAYMIVGSERHELYRKKLIIIE